MGTIDEYFCLIARLDPLCLCAFVPCDAGNYLPRAWATRTVYARRDSRASMSLFTYEEASGNRDQRVLQRKQRWSGR
jgi:hypothetical protein